MNSEAGIYGILSADVTLTGYVGTRIYPEVAPNGAENPCIVYSESTPEFSDNKDGVSKLDTNVIQVDVYSSTASERNTIAARVRTLLDRYSGTVNGIYIQSIRMIYSYKLIEPINDANDKKTYRQTMDFTVRQRII